MPHALRHELGDVIKERYVIREVLGGGAFGTVYRVEETLGAHTLVLACKEMHVLDDPETGAPERDDALRMFQEESFLLGTIRHPNIPAAHFESEKSTWLACPICGRTFRGTRQCPQHGADLQVVRERYYLLMDFIEGDDLEVRLQKNGGKALPETPVLDWAIQVCDALALVHAKGFSHRDIKPANIKIKRDTNQAMLIDFGLVKPSTVVGAYGTMPMTEGTRLGTPGYAPVSPQEQQHPDARTDILALGMTLYRLLTGLDPTDEAQLEVMRAKNPRSLVFSISAQTDALIQRATKINPADRYADVAALRADLSAARYPIATTCPTCGYIQHSALPPDQNTKCERCERPILQASAPISPPNVARPATKPTPPMPPKVAPNPYWPRIEAIRAELSAASPPLVSKHDARIHEIEELRAKAARASGRYDGQCPCCHVVKLLGVVEKPNGDCPICRQQKLQVRRWELQHCAVCREGNLTPRAGGKTMPCPVCRRAALREDERRKFGLVADIWWICPSCGAEWDELLGGQRAVLQKFHDDPHGIGAKYRGQTMFVADWRKLSGRGGDVLGCDNCGAQYDIVDGDKLTLADAGGDPSGQGAKLVGQTLPRAAWARLSRDLPSNAGTHGCGFCRAEFDYDTNEQTLTLVNPGQNAPDWAKQWLGAPVSLKTWYFKAAGKRSPNPGYVCPQCHTEFDVAANALRLVYTTQSALKPYIGTILPAPDWQRRAAGAPTEAEVIELGRELTSLQSQRALERSQLQQSETKRREGLHDELRSLLKQSVLGGFIPIKRMATSNTAHWVNQPGRFVVLPLDNNAHTAVQPGEELRWEMPATKMTLIMNPDGTPVTWNRDGKGTLTVTAERVFFTTPGQRLLQVSFHEIQRVEVYASSVGTQILEVMSSTFKQRTSFEIVDMPWTLVLDGALVELVMTPKDVAGLIRTLVERG